MITNLQLPHVKIDHAKLFGNFWIRSIFSGLAEDTQVRVLSISYVRLVESAIISFNRGVAATKEYWTTHNKIALGALQQATSSFESCVSDMHRACLFFDRLRRHPRLGSLSRINARRPSFLKTSQLRNARNQIHHMDKEIMSATPDMNSLSAIRADGPETPHPTESKQTIKTIDRLKVGNSELMLVDMHHWLLEMAEFCEVLSSAPNPGTPISQG